MDFIMLFLKQFGLMEWYPSTYGFMWTITLLITYHIYLTFKGDIRAEKIKTIMLTVGWIGVFYGVAHASFISANPEYETIEKLLYFFKLSAFAFHTIIYALVGIMIANVIELRRKHL